jgi:F-type H+-transporting ATPase subunit a
MDHGIKVEIAAQQIGSLFGIPITNTLITSWVVVALLIILALVVGSRVRLIPNRFQTLLEEMFGYVYDYIAETLESRDMARRFFPLLMTVFLFVLTSNLLEFLPGVGSFGFYMLDGFVPLFRSVNTDLNVPLMLAIMSFIIIEITGIVTIGFFKYGRKFIDLRSPLGFVIGVIELIGEMVRVVSLSFRLFGNILAGEVVLTVATYFAPYFLPVPLMMFELFIGTLQAAIFALLTLFFIKLAITEPH